MRYPDFMDKIKDLVEHLYYKWLLTICYSGTIDTRNHKYGGWKQFEDVKNFIRTEIERRCNYITNNYNKIKLYIELKQKCAESVDGNHCVMMMAVLYELFNEFSFPIMATMHGDDSDLFLDDFEEFLMKVYQVNQ